MGKKYINKIVYAIRNREMFVSNHKIMEYFLQVGSKFSLFFSVLQICATNSAMALRHHVSKQRNNTPMTKTVTHFKLQKNHSFTERHGLLPS